MAGYEPIKIKELIALRNDVVVTDMVFTERFSNSGLIIPSDNMKSAGVRPRWGKVYAVGPDQHDVKVGEWVMVAHGRWTRGVKIEVENDGEYIVRRVDINDILMVTDEEPTDETMSDAV